MLDNSILLRQSTRAVSLWVRERLREWAHDHHPLMVELRPPTIPMIELRPPPMVELRPPPPWLNCKHSRKSATSIYLIFCVLSSFYCQTFGWSSREEKIFTCEVALHFFGWGRVCRGFLQIFWGVVLALCLLAWLVTLAKWRANCGATILYINVDSFRYIEVL